jgi:hypothetical protein
LLVLAFGLQRLPKSVQVGRGEQLPVTLRDIVGVWEGLFKRVLPSGSKTTREWRRIWTPVLIGCSFCALFKAVLPIALAWVEYLPAGFISEVSLIYLCICVPFALRVAFWRLATFPIVGLWLPFLVQILSSWFSATFNAVLEKHLGFSLPFRLQSPFAAHQGPKNILACSIQMIVILLTAGLFEFAFVKYRWPREARWSLPHR